MLIMSATMSSMNRPIHFEIQSADPKATCDFFKRVFNWKFNAWEGPQEYFLAMTGDDGPGINGGIMRAPDRQARTVNVVDVDSIEDSVKRIEQAGGQIVVSKMAITGVGWAAYALDPTGVLFGIYKNDPSAK